MTRRTFTPAPTATASLYVRLSKEAGETSTGLDSQEADLRALAAARGLDVVAVHVDNGESGALRNRPGLLAWLADARAGRASTLLAWKVDRVSRGGLAGLAAFVDTLAGVDAEGRAISSPVRFLSVADSLDSTSPSWEIQLAVMGALAKGERDATSARISRGRKAREAQGRWNGGTAPYGLRPVANPHGPGMVLVVDEAEAALLRECASRILAGDNLTAAVRYANSPEGRAPRRAAEWSRVTLGQALKGDAARGPVLTVDESATLRLLLAVTPDARKSRRPGKRLLSGLLSCHSCGARLAVARRTDGTATYRCPSTASGSARCAAAVSVSATALDAYLAEEFLTRYGSTPYLVRRATVTGAADVEAAEEAVAEALITLGDSPTAEAFAALQTAHAARDEALAVPASTVVTLADSGRTVAEEWEALDVAGRRDLLAANLALVVVLPGRRGPRGISPDRLRVAWSPAHSDEAEDAAGYRRGRIVA